MWKYFTFLYTYFVLKIYFTFLIPTTTSPLWADWKKEAVYRSANLRWILAKTPGFLSKKNKQHPTFPGMKMLQEWETSPPFFTYHRKILLDIRINYKGSYITFSWTAPQILVNITVWLYLLWTIPISCGLFGLSCLTFSNIRGSEFSPNET